MPTCTIGLTNRCGYRGWTAWDEVLRDSLTGQHRASRTTIACGDRPVSNLAPPEERRLVRECNSKIKRIRAISHLLEAKGVTIEETIRLTAEARQTEAEYQKAETALQALRKARAAHGEA
jgi:hypothetical protein